MRVLLLNLTFALALLLSPLAAATGDAKPGLVGNQTADTTSAAANATVRSAVRDDAQPSTAFTACAVAATT